MFAKLRSVVRVIRSYSSIKVWKTHYLYFSYYDQCFGWKSHNPVSSMITFVLDMLWHFLLELRCNITSHKWVEEGHAGPDSGWISMSCTRCEQSHYHTLY